MWGKETGTVSKSRTWDTRRQKYVLESEGDTVETEGHLSSGVRSWLVLPRHWSPDAQDTTPPGGSARLPLLPPGGRFTLEAETQF